MHSYLEGWEDRFKLWNQRTCTGSRRHASKSPDNRCSVISQTYAPNQKMWELQAPGRRRDVLSKHRWPQWSKSTPTTVRLERWCRSAAVGGSGNWSLYTPPPDVGPVTCCHGDAACWPVSGGPEMTTVRRWCLRAAAPPPDGASGNPATYKYTHINTHTHRKRVISLPLWSDP